jgi:tetratricopeptide (TPR) repeat protein
MYKTTRSLIVAVTLAASLCACDAFVSADQRIARAEQKRDAGDERGAIIELQNALKSTPDNVKARLLLAELSLRMGDPKNAQKELDHAARSGADPRQTASLVAQTRLALGEPDQLLADLDAGKLPMSEAQQMTFRGLALLGKTQLQQAEDQFSKALATEPTLARARIGRAQAYAQLGRTEEAFTDIDAVLDSDRKNANALLLRASLLARSGEYKQALEAYRSARDHAQGQLTWMEVNTALAGSTECQLALGDAAAARTSQSELAARTPDAPLRCHCRCAENTDRGPSVFPGQAHSRSGAARQRQR